MYLYTHTHIYIYIDIYIHACTHIYEITCETRTIVARGLDANERASSRSKSRMFSGWPCETVGTKKKGLGQLWGMFQNKKERASSRSKSRMFSGWPCETVGKKRKKT